MKYKIYFSYSLFLLFISCNQDDKTSEVKVGMTYEEVETILDRPSSISRGAKELYYDANEISYDTLRLLNLDIDENGIDSSRWLAPHKVRTVGNLIYVTWIYDKTKVDTFYVLLNKFKKGKDTLKITFPVYYLGSRTVSKSEYNKSDGYEYRLQDNRIVDKSMYEAYKKSKLYNLPPPRKIEKNIKYKTNITVSSKDVKDSVEKIKYIVYYKYCVIFDASSGRVTISDYFPFFVSKLNGS